MGNFGMDDFKLKLDPIPVENDQAEGEKDENSSGF